MSIIRDGLIDYPLPNEINSDVSTVEYYEYPNDSVFTPRPYGRGSLDHQR